ncbi:hypothetical protein [Paenibacillus glacialis]|uniref:hypothetical protein n=1 Tax=Paenibacillus glacialis TaxID=494026 RepID=UPI0011AB8926|nr:hypothetical protein [Paenibacillus glacialis]
MRKGQSNPLKGRPRTVFDTVEEERDYLKVQVDFLKKQYSKSVKGGILSQQDNYQVIEELRSLHGVSRLLAIAGIPRASYYKWRATRSQHHKRTFHFLSV